MSGVYIAAGSALLLATVALVLATLAVYDRLSQSMATWRGAVLQRNAAREERDIAYETVERQAAEMGALMTALAAMREENAKRDAEARP
jgi:hypothetical protein